MYAVGAIWKLACFGHPEIDVAPTPERIGYGIFETRVERRRKVEELKQWWAENKEKVLAPEKQPPPVVVPLGRGTSDTPDAPKQP